MLGCTDRHLSKTSCNFFGKMSKQLQKKTGQLKPLCPTPPTSHLNDSLFTNKSKVISINWIDLH